MASLAEAASAAEVKPRKRLALHIDPVRIPVYAWLLLIVVLPNLLLIAISFLTASNGRLNFVLSFGNYARLLGSAGFWRLLEATLEFSLIASLCGALAAYPMAYFVGRIAHRNKALLTILVLVPLWISLLMRVFSWRLILGQNGVLNSFLVTSGLLEQPSAAFLYTAASVVLTFAYVSIPFVFISCLNAFEKIPAALIEASEDSGASKFQTFCFVIWPLTRRSLAIGFSLAFLVTVGDYVTPSMVGGMNGTTLGVLISSQFGMANNWPYGAALSIALILCVGVVLAVVLWLCPARGVFSGDEGGAAKARTHATPSALTTLSGALFYALAIAFLYAPLLLMVLFSLNDSTLQSFPLQGFTWRWYEALAGNGGLIAAAQRSVIVAVCVVLASTLIGTGFALTLHYRRGPGSQLIELLLALPLAMPAVVLGIVMVLGTELVGVPSGLPRTVVGQASFIMPVTMLLVLTRLRRLDPSLMEASRDLGAGRFRSFVHVIFPLIRGAVISGALLGLTLSADDVMVTLFLSGPSQTLPIWVFNQMRFGFTPSVNAVFTILGAIALTSVVLSQVVVRLRTNALSDMPGD
ncbi:ABC transporter permease subunit [Dongia sedimenti]|uniref:ABC transporter permease subunit n=1 Tax=Dongia sedimenti TaxID=3064282 RepID=A0ABU0YEQ1_9PROT|nr:ABC transporter permease subunit [Rhodospirillaceae bacterium R-7]